MAAGAWKLFNKAKKKIAVGTVNLSGAFGMALVKPMPAVSTSLLGQVTQVTSGNGYVALGKALSSETFTVSSGATATYRFDFGDVVWTATGGNITSIKGAIVYVSSGASAGTRHVLCYSTLTSSSNVTVASGNSLTVAMNTGGVFMMY